MRCGVMEVEIEAERQRSTWPFPWPFNVCIHAVRHIARRMNVDRRRLHGGGGAGVE